MSTPKVSVVMPVCNEVTYFNEALESVLLQTMCDFELIVIDGSDDQSIIPQMLPNDKRIKYIYRKKKGIADALNCGILNAHGKYIARMDADDISIIRRFELQVKYLDEHPEIDVLGTWYNIVDTNKNIIITKQPPISFEQIIVNMIFDNSICHPSVMFKRSLLKDGFMYPNEVAEDYALWTMLIPKCRFANYPEVLYVWRRTYNSNTNVMIKKVCESDIGSTKKYIHRLFGVDNNYPDEAFIKNYYKDRIRKCLKSNYIEIILAEWKLLNDVLKGCPKNLLTFLYIELEKRWKFFLRLEGCITLEIKEFSNFPWQNIGREKKYSDNIIKKMLFENRNKKIELRECRKKVVFYGLGKDGEKALYQLQKAIFEKKIFWELVGIIDKQEKTVVFKSKKINTVRIYDLKNIKYDLIIITSSKYYDCIYSELLNNKIDCEKIIDDSILFF